MNKIIIIDDDVDILTMVKMTLNINGFNVEAISKLEDIDSAIEQFVPDLILLDVSLGRADGREICKRLKSEQATRHIPVILFSANVEMENSVADCHAQAFIAKPFNLSDLLQTIRSHIALSKDDQASG